MNKVSTRRQLAMKEIQKREWYSLRSMLGYD